MATEATAQLTDDPSGWARRWTMELAAAKKALESWHKLGVSIDQVFRDEREDGISKGKTRWNLFTSTEQVLQAMLYGNTPKVCVSRRFADAKDDAARVAAEMLERLLNSDIERTSDSYATTLQYALQDRLLPGLGMARVLYVADFEDVAEVPAKMGEDGTELAPLVPATQKKSPGEDVEVEYVHWQDCLWNQARIWHEVRWLAFRAQMSREDLVERFGEEIGKVVPLNTKKDKERNDSDSSTDPWDRADVWEIWDKEKSRVYWFVEGYPTTLDMKEDPLGLDGFWPCPRPMAANLTTSKFVPVPDYKLAQDLYEEINALSSRIKLLQEALKVRGVYDKSAAEIKRLLSEGGGNELIPVENWAMFGEKGGLKGIVDWLPLDQVVNALSALRDYRREVIDGLYQITGMSDIMRGAATGPGVTATEQGIKAKFASVRVQALQDEFARFASDLQRLKAEIISKHFDPATILERSNAQFAFPEESIGPAVQLIKSQLSCYRVEVKPEAVSLTDFAALKQERTDVIGAISMFFTAATPLAQAVPGSMPFLLQMLQGLVAGLKGSSVLEGILDQGIAAAEAAQKQQAMNPQQQPPDPKVVALQMKGQLDQQKAQADMAKEQFKLQAGLVQNQAEVAGDAQREQDQAHWNTEEARGKAAVSAAAKALNPPRPPGGSGWGAGR